MISEPNINKLQLKEVLEKEYNFSIDEMFFNPKGEASWSYIIQTNKGKFFLKIYKTENFDSKVSDFTYRLFNECDIENIVHPLKTVSSNVELSFNDLKLVLFNFIDGKTIREQPLTDTQLENFGELLAKVHKSSEVVGPYEVRENFDVPFKENILKIYESLDTLENLNQTQEQTKETYKQYKDDFLGELKQLENLAEILKKQNVDFVNCHGEPSPGNIMVSSNDKIYLIDWDFPLYAPKEKDLMFFDDRLEHVLVGYRKLFPNAEINKEVRRFYGLLWNVQEIEDWGRRLLLENHSDEEYRHNYEELLHFMNYSGLKNK